MSHNHWMHYWSYYWRTDYKFLLLNIKKWSSHYEFIWIVCWMDHRFIVANSGHKVAGIQLHSKGVFGNHAFDQLLWKQNNPCMWLHHVDRMSLHCWCFKMFLIVNTDALSLTISKCIIWQLARLRNAMHIINCCVFTQKTWRFLAVSKWSHQFPLRAKFKVCQEISDKILMTVY